MSDRLSREEWRRVTVVGTERASTDMIALTVKPERWIPHRAGQYCDIRFPGETVVRAFSIVSSPTRSDSLVFGIQVLPRGLLSPRLAKLRSGDILEIRGPVGKFFTWTPDLPGRLVLIGAGAGITPLLSMYHLATSADGGGEPVFILSAKGPERVFQYARYAAVLTSRFTARDGRIDLPFLTETLEKNLAEDEAVQIRLCGPLGFIGHIVSLLEKTGIPDAEIRSEAFV